VDSFHRELGKIMWDYCGMARTREGPEGAGKIPALREEFWANVNVPGSGDGELNQSLGRPAAWRTSSNSAS
jgi:succinate dehydrogenase / fumarate reductase, flavoprotein subunit